MLIAELDAAVARHAPKWMRLSEPKLFERIDMWVMRFDPAGRRVPGQRIRRPLCRNRPHRTPDWRVSGRNCTLRTARLWIKSLTRLPERSARLIREPRSNVGRTRWERWPAGLAAMRCECGSPDSRRRNDVMRLTWSSMFWLTRRPISGDLNCPGYLPGFGPLPSTPLRDLATTAKVKPLVKPSTNPEPGYRPSAALAEFVRLPGLDLSVSRM